MNNYDTIKERHSSKLHFLLHGILAVMLSIVVISCNGADVRTLISIFDTPWQTSTTGAATGQTSTTGAATGQTSTTGAATGQTSTTGAATGQTSTTGAATGQTSTTGAATGQTSTTGAATGQTSTTGAATGQTSTTGAATGQTSTTGAATGQTSTTLQPPTSVTPVISRFSFGPFLTTHYQMNYKFVMEAEIDEQTKNIHFDKVIPNTDSISVEIEIPQRASLTVGGQIYDGPIVSFAFDPLLTRITVEEAGRSHDYTLSLMPTRLSTATSDDTKRIDDGNGSPVDALAIFTEANFEYMRNHLYLEKNYVLVNDITLTKNFEPIGNFNTGLEKLFDGGGKTVSNLKIVNLDRGYLGFFGSIRTGGRVRDLRLVLAAGDASNPSIKGGRFVGALAGSNIGTISKVSVVGGYVEGPTGVGGLVGFMYPPGHIENSYVTGVVKGPSQGIAGGLAGYVSTHDGVVRIKNSYVAGTVMGNGDVGGLVGLIEITDTSGRVEIENSYFDAGLIGQTQGVGDIDNRGSATLDITTYYTRGTTPNQKVFTMASGGREIQQSDFSGWDFTGDPANNVAPVWYFPGAGMWPRLAWQQ